jgi:hypothetical protein
MAEGSTIKLAEQCKRLIVNAELAIESRRFAVEGLSYLTLDADVKQFIVEDVALIRAMVEVAKRTGAVSVYSMASIFVNLTNSYPKPEHLAKAEMKKLAEFSKHHVPEEHEKDADKYVRQRVAILVREGATSACVAVAKTDSTKCMDLLVRCLAAFTLDKAHRGQVVAEGGAKLLLRLALEAAEEARPISAQALARVGITISPEIAFPGQRMYEVVRPLLDLLHPERTALQNYEALLTLTNLAGHSDSVRWAALNSSSVYILTCLQKANTEREMYTENRGILVHARTSRTARGCMRASIEFDALRRGKRTGYTNTLWHVCDAGTKNTTGGRHRSIEVVVFIRW